MAEKAVLDTEEENEEGTSDQFNKSGNLAGLRHLQSYTAATDGRLVKAIAKI